MTLRKVNLKPYRFNKWKLMEDSRSQIRDQFNERNNACKKFYSMLLNKVHPYYDENGRKCKTLFANYDIIKPNIQTNLNYI